MSLSSSALPESKEINIDELCTRLTMSASRVVYFLESKLQENGSYGEEIEDIACYFKSPMMFITAKKFDSAMNILNYIQKSFMSEDGDFKTTSDLKSKNSAYIEYWSYVNGWIVRAAHLLDLKNMSEPGYHYLKQYHLDMGEQAGFRTNNVENEPFTSDVLTVAHHGLINLEMGNIAIATSAGNYLCSAIQEQPSLYEGFYLRRNQQGEFITQFSAEQAPFYFVSTTAQNQLHFMIGYPCAYLVMLYKKTQNKIFLDAAEKYFDFSLSCDKSMYECNFSHKIAWAASFLYECTGDEKYIDVIEKISRFFIRNQQENGMWYSEGINSSYDQSAEIACWFLNIIQNINNYKKKLGIEENPDRKKPLNHVT